MRPAMGKVCYDNNVEDLSSEEYRSVDLYLQVLEPIRRFEVKLQQESVPTISLVYSGICGILDMLEGLKVRYKPAKKSPQSPHMLAFRHNEVFHSSALRFSPNCATASQMCSTQGKTDRTPSTLLAPASTQLWRKPRISSTRSWTFAVKQSKKWYACKNAKKNI